MIEFLKSSIFKKAFFRNSTYLFVGTLPLFLSINTIAIWIFVVSSFTVMSLKERKQILWKRRAFVLPFVLLFFLYVLGIFLSTDTAVAIKNLTRVLTLLLLPTVILSHKKEDFNFKYIYYALGAGLLIGMVICWSINTFSFFPLFIRIEQPCSILSFYIGLSILLNSKTKY